MNKDTPVFQNSMKVLLNKVNGAISSNADLDLEKKNELSGMMKEFDFLLGKYHDLYQQFITVFTAMGRLDFSHKLAISDKEDNFISFIASSLNVVNEELASAAIGKNVIHTLIDSVMLSDTMMIITNVDGRIYFANSGANGIPDFSDKTLQGKRINSLFEDFSIIDRRIKDGINLSNIDMILKFQDRKFAVKTSLTLATEGGKIESVIYLIHLPESLYKRLPK